MAKGSTIIETDPILAGITLRVDTERRYIHTHLVDKMKL